MTGAELLAQVRSTLALSGLPPSLDALDGCVLLTAEEAEKVLVWDNEKGLYVPLLESALLGGAA